MDDAGLKWTDARDGAGSDGWREAAGGAEMMTVSWSYNCRDETAESHGVWGSPAIFDVIPTTLPYLRQRMDPRLGLQT
jgi:hypothetical protein